MTFNEYLQAVRELLHKEPTLRVGQAYFGQLFKDYPELASKIAGTFLDPFYDDKVIPDFLAFVATEW